MSKEANIATQKKMGEIVNGYHFEKLHEVFAPGVKDHDPADDQGPGPEGFVHWFTQFHSAFPDFKIAVEHMVVDEDKRVLRLYHHWNTGWPIQRHPRYRKED